MPADLTLYADAKFTSPYVMSVFVTLTEKPIPFQIKTVDLAADENKGERHARLSLTQRASIFLQQPIDRALSDRAKAAAEKLIAAADALIAKSGGKLFSAPGRSPIPISP